MAIGHRPSEHNNCEFFSLPHTGLKTAPSWRVGPLGGGDQGDVAQDPAKEKGGFNLGLAWRMVGGQVLPPPVTQKHSTIRGSPTRSASPGANGARGWGIPQGVTEVQAPTDHSAKPPFFFLPKRQNA